jgi:hypothetical protein
MGGLAAKGAAEQACNAAHCAGRPVLTPHSMPGRSAIRSPSPPVPPSHKPPHAAKSCMGCAASGHLHAALLTSWHLRSGAGVSMDLDCTDLCATDRSAVSLGNLGRCRYPRTHARHAWGGPGQQTCLTNLFVFAAVCSRSGSYAALPLPLHAPWPACGRRQHLEARGLRSPAG